MHRLSGLFMLSLLIASPALAQVAEKSAVLSKADVETDFVTQAAIERLRGELVLMKTDKGITAPANEHVDDSDMSEIFARFAWVVWGKEALPDDARRRTNARANSQRIDIYKKWLIEIDFTLIKQSFSVIISRLNDQIREKKTIDALETRIKALEANQTAQKQ